MPAALGDDLNHVLLVRLSALGDVVQCLEALAALRAARPQARIGWLVEDRHAALLADHPHIDELFVFRRKERGLARLRAVRALRRELRAFDPDVAVDLQGNLKGAFLTRLSGASRRIGLPAGETREGAHWFATEHVAPGRPNEHRADRALRLIAPLLGSRPSADSAAQLAPVSSDAKAALDPVLAGLGAYAVLVPGTSAFGAFKRWPPERFGELAQRLRAETSLRVVVSAGPGEDDLADAVVRHALGTAERAPATTSLGQLVHLLQHAQLVVGADSGPVVLASVSGAPTVALLGPKDPRIYAPRGPRTAVVWKGVYCSPCTLRQCGEPICMTTLSVERVWNGVQTVLSGVVPSRVPDGTLA